MNWTEEEQELIAIFDSYIEKCSTSAFMQDGTFYRYIPQILAVTQGDVRKTSQYCQEVIATGSFSPFKQQQSPSRLKISAAASAVAPEEIPIIRPQGWQEARLHYTRKFSVFWTALFAGIAASTVFFLAKRSPNIDSVSTYQNLALFCPSSVLANARSALERRDGAAIFSAIAELEKLEVQQAGKLDPECQQILWQSQLIYAIEFLASSGKQKQAVTYLCKISPDFLQDKGITPWFARWSNTNNSFAAWLSDYKLRNSCAAASYLE